MSQIWFGKSKIIKQVFKCNILVENAPPPHFQLHFLPQQHIYEPKINIYWSTVMSLKLKTYCPLIKVPFNLLVFVWMLHIYIYCSSMQISSAMLDESVGGQQLLSLPNISDWIQGWLYSCSSSKPPFYPFCCVLCVIVLMENQSSPCGSLANWSRFSKDPILVKISTAWYCEVYLVCATYNTSLSGQRAQF